MAGKISAADSFYRLYQYRRDNPFIEECRAVFETGDYLKAMREFTRRIGVSIDGLELDRVHRGSPLTEHPLSAGDCVPGGMAADLTGKVVVIRAEVLAPEYRLRSHQMMLAMRGFGCAPNASGRAVFCTNLYSGEKARWNRSDIAGVIAEDTLPEWARDKLAVLRGGGETEKFASKEVPAEKPESTLAKIREAKRQPKQPRKAKARDKSCREEL
ncbi:MAG: hypothetical protein LBL37_08540 [Gracilibacteraceae bacterium]|nr:hypothetical protein [Gracilibacteraceae bacterium]